MKIILTASYTKVPDVPHLHERPVTRVRARVYAVIQQVRHIRHSEVL